MGEGGGSAGGCEAEAGCLARRGPRGLLMPAGGVPIDSVPVPPPHGDHADHQFRVPHLVDQAVADRPQLDLVAIGGAMQAGGRHMRVFQPLGQLFLELRADRRPQGVPFFLGFFAEAEAIGHPG